MSTEQNPTTEMQAFAKLVDQFFDENMSDLTQGMSPIAITLAFSDWLMHLASSPGEQLLRAQQAWTFFKRRCKTLCTLSLLTQAARKQKLTHVSKTLRGPNGLIGY